jgi:PAS domain S-box-containing protein
MARSQQRWLMFGQDCRIVERAFNLHLKQVILIPVQARSVGTCRLACVHLPQRTTMTLAIVPLLLIENDAADAALVQAALQNSPLADFQGVRAERLSDGLELLQSRSFEAVVLDENLPDGQGLELLHHVRRQAPSVPIVVLSRVSAPLSALEAVRAGAQDCLLKEPAGWEAALPRTLCLAIERQRAQAAAQEREEFFTTLVQNGAHLTLVTDLNGVVTYVSPHCEQVLGHPPDRLLGKTLPNFIHPEDRARVGETSDLVLKQGREFYEYEYRIIDGQGGVRWVAHSARLAATPHGLVGMQMTLRNITDRKRSDQALRESEARFKALFANHNIGMLLVDSGTGAIVDANPAAEAFYGYSWQQLTQLLIDDLNLPLPDEPKHDRARRAAANQPVYQHRLANGEVRVVEVHVAPLEVSGRTVLFSIIHDVTERRRAEDAVAQLIRRQESILNSVGEGIYGIDPDGRITFANPALAQLVGWPAADLLGQPAHAFLHHTLSDGHPYPQAECPAYQTLRDGQARHSDDEILWRQDGRPIPVEYTSAPMRDGGQVTGAVVAVKDITPRREAEQTARRQAARAVELARLSQLLASAFTRYEAVLDIIVRQVAGLVGDGCIVQLVAEAGQPAPAPTLFHPDPVAQASLAEMAAGLPVAHTLQMDLPWETGPIVLEADPRNPLALGSHPGGEAWLRQFGPTHGVIALLRAQGQVIGTLVCLRHTVNRPFDADEKAFLQDLTDRAALGIANARLLEQVQRANVELEGRVAVRTAELSARTIELRQANEDLERLIRGKDEFLAGMSHELRNPLTSILGLAEALQMDVYGTLSEKQRSSLGIIHQSGRHLLALINDVLDLAKVEAGKLELELAPVSVAGVCQASLYLLQGQAHKKQIKVALNIDPAALLLWADERRLKQILVNLLSNAIKFTPEKGQIGLSVSLEQEREEIHFAVWDTGMGVAPELQARLFQPFVQVNTALTRGATGSGLGLSLVRRMAELHGGRVMLESSGISGQGSRFTVVLPWRVSALAAPLAQSDTPVAADGAARTAETRLILVADDADDIRELFAAFLTKLGYMTTQARDGLEAWRMISTLKPAAVLLDVQMPGLDGLEVTRRVRADPALALTPIIAVTALVMSGDRERCLQAGADRYLVKPVGLRELKETLAAVLPPKAPAR